MPRRGMYYKARPPYPSFYPGDVVEIKRGRFAGQTGYVKEMDIPGREAYREDPETGDYYRDPETGRITRTFGPGFGSVGQYNVYLPDLDVEKTFKVGNLTLDEPGFGAGDPRLRHPMSKAQISREAVDYDYTKGQWSELAGTEGRGHYMKLDYSPEELRQKSQELRLIAREFRAPEAYQVARELDYQADLQERNP